MKKYGVKSTAQLNWVKEKAKKTCLNKYKHISSEIGQIKNLNLYNDKNFIQKNFFDKNKKFKLYEFRKFFNCGQVAAHNTIKRLNIEYSKYQKYSQKEKEILNFIKFQDFTIIENSRDTIKPKELDIYIPEKNLAIEFDGLYWHSEGLKNNFKNNIRRYHLEKTKACESKNINLLHIFENEWLDPIKQDIWKSIISYKLGIVKQKYYARKLELREVSKAEARSFLNKNHLQGACNAKVNLGLYNKDELISLMTFSKPRYNKNYEYELIRFVSKKYSSCIGCAQKLFKNFIKLYNPKNIISYANRRFASSLSNIYKTLGLKFIKETEPNYYYFHIKNPMKLYHRSHFQKYKLKKYEDTEDLWDESKTEFQIMSEAGYRRIYDCGQLVYEYEGEN